MRITAGLIVVTLMAIAAVGDERGEMFAAFRRANVELEAFWKPCQACKSRGFIMEQPQQGGKVEKRSCSSCLGSGATLNGDLNQFLSCYLAYCDLQTRFSGELQEQKNQKLAKDVLAIRERAAKEICARAGIDWRFRDRHPWEPQSPVAYSDIVPGPIAQRALDMLRQQHPAAGQGLAFTGVVDELSASGEAVMTLVCDRERTDVTCLVEFPAGMGWPVGDRVIIIGKTAGERDRRCVIQAYPGSTAAR